MHTKFPLMIETFGEDVTKRMVISVTIKNCTITEGFSEKLRGEVSPYDTVSQFCEMVCKKVGEEGFATSKEEVLQIWLTTIVCELM